MNISSAAAVCRSTKRGRSPRTAAAAAAANHGVALSRVGKQLTRIEEVYMTGTIRTLRVDKGFGFIKSEAGQDVFFHQNAIYGEGIADLREGDGVEFGVTDSPKGPRAVDVKRTTT